MAEKRNLRPRARPTRPLGARDDGPSERWDPPTWDDASQLWAIPNKLGQRLHEKSRLGVQLPNGNFGMNDVEVLFSHWNRHLPLPSEAWLDERLDLNPNLLAEAVVMDTARSGGEVVVPGGRVDGFADAWAVRWSRHAKPPSTPRARCEWTHASRSVEWESLVHLADVAGEQGVVTEWYVVDEELDVTMYHVERVDFSGRLTTWSQLDRSTQEKVRRAWEERVPCSDGHRLPLIHGAWPWPQLGTTHASGRILRREESEILAHILDDADLSAISELALTLMSQGVLLRPGFKYGCRWRVYDDDMDAVHAPWLLQTADRRPSTWEDVCLAVRLAEGVNKTWVTDVALNGTVRWLSIRRALPGRE